MVTESTISWIHQLSSCYVVLIIDHRTATHAALPLELRLHLMCRSACSWRLAVHTGGSLASISYEVSDDSLSRLVARIGCRVSPHVHNTVGRPIGGAGRPGALWRIYVYACAYVRVRARRVWNPKWNIDRKFRDDVPYLPEYKSHRSKSRTPPPPPPPRIQRQIKTISRTEVTPIVAHELRAKMSGCWWRELLVGEHGARASYF